MIQSTNGLVLKAQKGDKKAEEELYKSVESLIWKVAIDAGKRRKIGRSAVRELFSDLVLVYLACLKNFDALKGAKFTTYLSTCLKFRAPTAIFANIGPIRTPQWVIDQRLREGKYPVEAPDSLDFKVQKKRSESLEVHDVLPAKENTETQDKDFVSTLAKILVSNTRAKDKERLVKIFVARTLCGRGLSDISEELKVSKERVRQINVRCLEILKENEKEWR
jgi:RNA polymerase sigma factor (sigma-70 family)